LVELVWAGLEDRAMTYRFKDSLFGSRQLCRRHGCRSSSKGFHSGLPSDAKAVHWKVKSSRTFHELNPGIPLSRAHQIEKSIDF
jgi:hypothetical protein